MVRDNDDLHRTRSALERPDLSGKTRMRRYLPWQRAMELRPPNRGKEIIDNLPTIVVDPRVLDIASEVEPLSAEGTPFFANTRALMVRQEIPKWRRHGQFKRYFLGIRAGGKGMQRQQRENRFRVGSPQVEPAALKASIRSYAAAQGFALCGFTFVDRRFIGEGADEAFPYDSAVVLGMEMDPALVDAMPTLEGPLPDFETYVDAGLGVLEVARHIRSLGYRCVARIAFDSIVKYIPHAVAAGIAELGANGMAVTPQFGPRQRWAMISVDADIEPDAPADFGISDYCEDCLLCVYGCPGRALSEEKMWWRGVYKHKLDPVRCWPYFSKFDGCMICTKVCPLHRFGYEACMEAYQRDGTILGKPKGIDRFLERRAARSR
jgi:ferredoxin